jgi:hypothetical protein
MNSRLLFAGSQPIRCRSTRAVYRQLRRVHLETPERALKVPVRLQAIPGIGRHLGFFFCVSAGSLLLGSAFTNAETNSREAKLKQRSSLQDRLDTVRLSSMFSECALAFSCVGCLIRDQLARNVANILRFGIVTTARASSKASEVLPACSDRHTLFSKPTLYHRMRVVAQQI